MKLRLILPCLSIAVVACGCGGGSSSAGGGGGGGGKNAVFAGSYVGAFTNSGANTDTGEFAINISSSGSITGRYIDVTSANTGAPKSGQITFGSSTATTDTGSVAITDPTGTATGNLTLTLSTGTITGSITNTTTGLTINFTSGLVSTAGKNSFAGFYGGTYTVNGVAGTPPNTVAVIVDGNGNATGLEVDNIAGQSGDGGIGLGTINSNTGAMTIGNESGPVAVKNGVFTGTLENAAKTTTQVLTLSANK